MAVGPDPVTAFGLGDAASDEGLAAICNKLLISLLPTIAAECFVGLQNTAGCFDQEYLIILIGH